MVRLYTAHNTNGVVNRWVYKEDNELFINTLVNMYILFNVDIYVWKKSNFTINVDPTVFVLWRLFRLDVTSVATFN